MTLRSILLLSVCASFLTSVSVAGETRDGRLDVTSNLRAGVAKVDITPDVTKGLPVVGQASSS
jgi:hypothetical protein